MAAALNAARDDPLMFACFGEDEAVAISAGSSGAGWRVFLSHTSELRDFPKGGSFVAAVERAVTACGHVIVDMADFPAADQVPAELCRKRVQSCAVYVGIFGTRYGMPVRDMPEVSYTELEFDTATHEGLARLVFLLDTDAADVGIPVSKLIDLEFGARQEAFRRRVQDSGLVTQTFAHPAALGQLVERSLRELATNSATTAKADATLYWYLIMTRSAPEWQAVDHFDVTVDGLVAVLDDGAHTQVSWRDIRLINRFGKSAWRKTSEASGWQPVAEVIVAKRYWIKTSATSGWQAVDHFEQGSDGLVAVLDDGAHTMVEAANIRLLTYSAVP
jgi:hypothetical protein